LVKALAGALVININSESFLIFCVENLENGASAQNKVSKYSEEMEGLVPNNH